MMTSSFLKVTGAVVALLVLVGCGSDESADATSGDSVNTVQSPQTEVSPAPVELDLPTTSINRELFLGLKKPEPVKPEPCPFLSDETALNTAQRSDKLVRRTASNAECYWSQNSGFSVRVKIETLASAKPLRDRAYNLDSPPIFEPQSAPGRNAMVLLDTVWKEKGTPYAMGFEQADKLVTIYVTGLHTDTARLVATATEVAAKLPDAPRLEAQLAGSERYDMCSIWSEDVISTVVGSAVTAVKTDDRCVWKSDDALIDIGLYYGRDFPFDSLIEQGAVDIQDLGVRAIIHRQRAKGSRPAASVLDITLGDEKMVNIKVSESTSESKAVAIALAKNLIGRF